ncbi:TPA: MoxR family ATPase, partial [Clostridioides difficile]|nr:MoxR family ATPase [Clostridioides difficile]
IFHYIEFPDRDMMEEIVKVHFDKVEEHLLEQVMTTFYWIRSLKDIQKKPSTSELIDWIQALTLSGMPIEKIEKEVPFAGILLKNNEDIESMQRHL